MDRIGYRRTVTSRVSLVFTKEESLVMNGRLEPLHWHCVGTFMSWMACRAHGDEWDINVKEDGMFHVFATEESFETLKAAQEWCQSQEERVMG